MSWPNKKFPAQGETFFELDEDFITAAGTVAIGDVLELDRSAVDSNFRWTTALATQSTADGRGYYGVALTSGSSGQQIRVRFRGIVDALCNAAVTIGDQLKARSATTNSLIAIAVDGRVTAVALVTNAGGPAVNKVYFNGIEGLGHRSV